MMSRLMFRTRFFDAPELVGRSLNLIFAFLKPAEAAKQGFFWRISKIVSHDSVR